MPFCNVSELPAVETFNNKGPTIFVPTSEELEPQTNVVGVACPPTFTDNGLAAVEKPPPLSPHWNVAPLVPKLRVKLVASRTCSTPPLIVRKLFVGIPVPPLIPACNTPPLMVTFPV